MTRTRRLVAVLGMSLALAGMAAPALASWAVGSSGATGKASAGSISAPASVGTTAQTSTSITLRVVAGPGSGGTPASYRVDRTAGSSPGPATGVCTISAVGGTCDDTGLSPATSYTYVIRSVLGGWVSGPSSTITTSTATAPPSTPDLRSSSDSGLLNSDNITNDTTPTFAGTAPANSTVRLFSGATQIGSQTLTNGSTNWSITSSGLTDGVKAITATATVSGSTSDPSAALSVTIDTVRPVASDIQTTSSNNDNEPNTGDDLILTYSEAMDPGRILNSWNGSALSVRLTVDGNNKADTASVTDTSNHTVNLGTVALNGNYKVNGACSPSSSCQVNGTMTLTTVSGRSVLTIAITSSASALYADTSNSDMAWSVSSSVRDLAGNSGSTGTTGSESGPSDPDF